MNRLAETHLPTKWGIFNMVAYQGPANDMPHLAMVSQDFDAAKAVVVRIHSECLTGDLFGSVRCDCGEQLDKALEVTSKCGGVVLYLRQEGRGIGLINKMKAYNLQDTGLNTVDANTHLGFEPDERSYEIAIKILQDLGIKNIHLLTNNPEKLHAFDNAAVTVKSRMPIIIQPKEENENYLQVKQEQMGHLLDMKIVTEKKAEK